MFDADFVEIKTFFYFNNIKKISLSVIFIIECKDSLKTTYIQQGIIIISFNLRISLDYKVKIIYFCISKRVKEL